MHILHVACMPYPTMQGSQIYLKGLLRAQAKSHVVSLLCYGHGMEIGDEPYNIIRVRDIPGYDRMRAGPDCYKPFLDILIAKKLWALDADIIHVHNYEAPFAAFIRRIRSKTPIVYTAHNLMEEELETYFENPYLKSISRIMGGWLDRNIPKKADAIIALRRETAVILEKLGGKNVFFVPPAVERLCSDTEKSSHPTVLYTGNVDAYQNLDAFFSLAKRMPDIAFRIVTSNTRGLPDFGLKNVSIYETSQFSEVCTEIGKAHMLLVPRRICSGFPMKLLNALALGTPVVTFSSTVSLLPGVVSCHHLSEMEKNIRDLIFQPERANRLGQAGKEFVQQNCTWENCAKEVEKIYNSVYP